MKLDKNYKVRVTPEQSREIQELVFKLGGNLQSGDTFVKETHLERLYVSKCLKMSFGLTEHGWSYQEGATIQADDLIALLTDLSKSAENPLQGVELTPEFEVVAPHVNPPSNDGATYVSEPYNDVLFPRFEVGQKAYCPWLNDGELVTLGLDDNGDLIAQTKKGLQAFDCEGYALDCTPRQPDLFPATNYYFEHLSAIMPWIKFEQPPTQADIDNEAVDKLAQAMKNKLAKKREQGYHGWETCKHGDLVQLLINHVDKGDPIDVANFCAFLFARGELLTESVLGE